MHINIDFASFPSKCAIYRWKVLILCFFSIQIGKIQIPLDSYLHVNLFSLGKFGWILCIMDQEEFPKNKWDAVSGASKYNRSTPWTPIILIKWLQQTEMAHITFQSTDNDSNGIWIELRNEKSTPPINTISLILLFILLLDEVYCIKLYPSGYLRRYIHSNFIGSNTWCLVWSFQHLLFPDTNFHFHRWGNLGIDTRRSTIVLVLDTHRFSHIDVLIMQKHGYNFSITCYWMNVASISYSYENRGGLVFSKAWIISLIVSRQHCNCTVLKTSNKKICIGIFYIQIHWFLMQISTIWTPFVYISMICPNSLALACWFRCIILLYWEQA